MRLFQKSLWSPFFFIFLENFIVGQFLMEFLIQQGFGCEPNWFQRPLRTNSMKSKLIFYFDILTLLITPHDRENPVLNHTGFLVNDSKILFQTKIGFFKLFEQTNVLLRNKSRGKNFSSTSHPFLHSKKPVLLCFISQICPLLRFRIKNALSNSERKSHQINCYRKFNLWTRSQDNLL